MASQIDLLSKDGIIIPENARKLKKMLVSRLGDIFFEVALPGKCSLQPCSQHCKMSEEGDCAPLISGASFSQPQMNKIVLVKYA